MRNLKRFWLADTHESRNMLSQCDCLELPVEVSQNMEDRWHRMDATGCDYSFPVPDADAVFHRALADYS